MNKIDKLITKLCPKGVEFKELGEICDYEQPTKYTVKSVNSGMLKKFRICNLEIKKLYL